MLAISNVVYFGISIAKNYDYFFFKSIGATAPAKPPATPPAITEAPSNPKSFKATVVTIAVIAEIRQINSIGLFFMVLLNSYSKDMK